MSSAPLFIQVPLRWDRPRPVEAPSPPPAEREDVRQLRAALGEHAREVVSGRELLGRVEKASRGALATGVGPLDALLGGGLPKGKLIEMIGARSSGRWSAVVAALAGVTGCGEAAALVDHGGHFDPQIAAEAGVDLERLLLVAPQRLKDCVAAAELLLATGFPLVAVDLGMRVRGKRVPDAAWVRLARAAAAHGAALVVSSPYSLAGMAAEGVVRTGRGVPRWNRRGAPLLEGLDSRLAIERHRHMREGMQNDYRVEQLHS
ncbi:MAG: hypothetical protein ACRD2J_15540 [Thermoanaerobaculia bacterium]